MVSLILAASSATSSSAAPKEAPPPQPSPSKIALLRELPVKAEDGRAFTADFYTPGGAASFPGVLVIPNLGSDRKPLGHIGVELAERGYAVLIMDNTGNDRNITRNEQGVPMIKMARLQILDELIMDARPAVRLLLDQPGVARGGIAVLGVGLGANVGLVDAADSADVAAIALVLPSWGCEKFDPVDLLGRLGRRPALLVNSRKKKANDISKAFDEVSSGPNSTVREHVVLEPTTRTDGEDEFTSHPGLDRTVMDWLAKRFPASTRR